MTTIQKEYQCKQLHEKLNLEPNTKYPEKIV